MQITQCMLGEATILVLTGHLTTVKSPGLFEDTVGHVVRNGSRVIVVDLAGISGIDASGLGALAAGRRAALGECAFRLIHVTRRLRALLHVTSLDTVLETSASLEDAVRIAFA